jgi:hypothetical protein
MVFLVEGTSTTWIKRLESFVKLMSMNSILEASLQYCTLVVRRDNTEYLIKSTRGQDKEALENIF